MPPAMSYGHFSSLKRQLQYYQKERTRVQQYKYHRAAGVSYYFAFCVAVRTYTLPLQPGRLRVYVCVFFP